MQVCGKVNVYNSDCPGSWICLWLAGGGWSWRLDPAWLCWSWWAASYWLLGVPAAGRLAGPRLAACCWLRLSWGHYRFRGPPAAAGRSRVLLPQTGRHRQTPTCRGNICQVSKSSKKGQNGRLKMNNITQTKYQVVVLSTQLDNAKL